MHKSYKSQLFGVSFLVNIHLDTLQLKETTETLTGNCMKELKYICPQFVSVKTCQQKTLQLDN